MVASSDKPFTGITRHPSDEIKAIRALLDDVYKDGGDGSTIVRELIQNADDAGASRVELVILDQGFAEPRNSLLRGPALLVANNGAFSQDDATALHQAIGGSKEDDPSKIGTFGIGLKSVFHACEAFAYVGASASHEVVRVLNPWTSAIPSFSSHN